MKNKYFKYTIFLASLAFIISLLLFGINYFTSEKVKDNEINKVIEYLKEVDKDVEWKTYEKNEGVYLGYENDSIKIYAFKTRNIGYNSGEIVSLTFIEEELIKKIKIISMENQTSGIGTQIGEEDYLKSFEGDNIYKYLNKESSDLKEDIISNASISSKAFLNGIIQSVNLYYDLFNENKDYSYLEKEGKNWEEINITDKKIMKIYKSEEDIYAYKAKINYLIYGEKYADLEILFFINNNNIHKIYVTYNSQTSEYGLKINDQNYLDSFISKNISSYANEEYSDSDIISGSTVSSNALLDLITYVSDYHLKEYSNE